MFLPTLIVGTAQEVAGTTHAPTIDRLGKHIVDSAPNKQYLYIGLNRSSRTMLDDGKRATRKMTKVHSRERPDLIAVYWDPGTQSPKVELYEVPSGNQGEELIPKMEAIMREYPTSWRTDITRVVNRD